MNSILGQFSLLGFENWLTVSTNHLDNEAAFGLVWLVLYMTFAALNCSIFVTPLSWTALEDRKKSLHTSASILEVCFDNTEYFIV